MPKAPSRSSAMTIGAVLLGALVMTWPALYNRYPLLYPDSVSYLGDGSAVARALFLRQFSDYYGFRSLIYSLGILPLHWQVAPWPIVAVNALLTSYVLWLVVRSFSPANTAAHFLTLVTALSTLTGLGWLVGWIMPDIFGPVLYLCIYLLLFAGEDLSKPEQAVVALMACWGAVSHATHLLLAGSFCLVTIAMLALRWRAGRVFLRPVATVAAVILASAVLQMTLNEYLYHQLSLNGDRPPFLLARVFVDGPGRWYLEKHCGELHLAICGELQELPDNVDDFLWGDQGWSEADAERQTQLQREELPVVLGTLRTYTREELLICLRHFWQQLCAYGIYSYDNNQWMSENIDVAMPGQGPHYQRSRQAQGTLPEELFTSVQHWTVVASLIVIVAGVLFARRWWTRRLIGLTVIVGFFVIANAAVTGNLSDPEDRLQARVIWLLPLLAAIFIGTWLNRRPIRQRSA
jgi:hypothetical protein